MSDTVRILVTGSRRWSDVNAVSRALLRSLGEHPFGEDPSRLPVLVHGGAVGADAIADRVWRGWIGLLPDYLPARFATPEVHRAQDFPSPRARNQHMVDLGATICLAFAESWDSGTGMCARMARRAGIPVIDHGVGTASRAPAAGR